MVVELYVTLKRHSAKVPLPLSHANSDAIRIKRTPERLVRNWLASAFVGDKKLSIRADE